MEEELHIMVLRKMKELLLLNSISEHDFKYTKDF